MRRVTHILERVLLHLKKDHDEALGAEQRRTCRVGADRRSTSLNTSRLCSYSLRVVQPKTRLRMFGDLPDDAGPVVSTAS